jgi:hypothetical protein
MGLQYVWTRVDAWRYGSRIFGSLGIASLIYMRVSVGYRKKGISMTTSDYILLYRPEKPSDNVTIARYEQWCAKENRREITQFVYDRLHGRYLKPFEFEDRRFVKEFRNGFAMMANCCLLIETLESFYHGWGTSRGKREEAFQKFFAHKKRFADFATNGLPMAFYRNIRCGILHQGETKGGWRITRKAKAPLFQPERREINAVKFMAALKLSLGDYRDLLVLSEWDSEVWHNLRKKMKTVVENCAG